MPEDGSESCNSAPDSVQVDVPVTSPEVGTVTESTTEQGDTPEERQQRLQQIEEEQADLRTQAEMEFEQVITTHTQFILPLAPEDKANYNGLFAKLAALHYSEDIWSDVSVLNKVSTLATNLEEVIRHWDKTLLGASQQSGGEEMLKATEAMDKLSKSVDQAGLGEDLANNFHALGKIYKRYAKLENERKGLEEGVDVATTVGGDVPENEPDVIITHTSGSDTPSGSDTLMQVVPNDSLASESVMTELVHGLDELQIDPKEYPQGIDPNTLMQLVEVLREASSSNKLGPYKLDTSSFTKVGHYFAFALPPGMIYTLTRRVGEGDSTIEVYVDQNGRLYMKDGIRSTTVGLITEQNRPTTQNKTDPGPDYRSSIRTEDPNNLEITIEIPTDKNKAIFNTKRSDPVVIPPQFHTD